MRTRFFLLTFIFCLLCTGQANAQEQGGKFPLTGTVVDDNGEPLPGAYILITGTTEGTTTDADGKFTISVSSGNQLEIQFLGYETKTVPVPKEKRNISVTLSPDKNLTLNESVTIAYGSVRKQDLTGSVANVKMGDIKDAPVLSVDQALQGRIAGADIMTTSGEPGASTSIRIRGTRSIIASNEPLIVVDGIMDAVSDLGDLKDESAWKKVADYVVPDGVMNGQEREWQLPALKQYDFALPLEMLGKDKVYIRLRPSSRVSNTLYFGEGTVEDGTAGNKIYNIEPRRKASEMIVDQVEKMVGEQKASVFVVGDMNCSLYDGATRNGPYSLEPLMEYMWSARDEAAYYDGAVSFNGFNPDYNKKVGNIDHIFYRGAEALEFRTANRQDYGKRFISDHYPVTCTFKL